MPFIAGAFEAVIGGNTAGQIMEGFTIEWFSNQQPIIGDARGRTPQDHVMQNIEVFVELTLMEWDAVGAQSLFWPVNATLGTGPIIGSLATGIAFPQLVLTAVGDTTAAGITAQDTWTFPDVQLQEGFPVRILLAPALRDVVLRLRVYPNSSNVFFTAS